MNVNRTFPISEWKDPVGDPTPGLKAGSGRMAWIGVMGSLVIHALALQSVLLGSRAPKVHSLEVQGPGASLIKSESEPSESLILLDLPVATVSSKPLVEDFASAGSAPKNLRVTVVSPDPLPHVDIHQDGVENDPAAVPSVDSGDLAERAALFSRYTGQIDARIERAWRRPRSPVQPETSTLQNASTQPGSDAPFRCQVRIIQDGRGRVEEVQLLNCNGSVAWQHSLVVAILTASPLPAPLSPTVFTRTLTMTFEAGAYTAGGSEDDYEPESKTPMLTASDAQKIATSGNP